MTIRLRYRYPQFQKDEIEELVWGILLAGSIQVEVLSCDIGEKRTQATIFCVDYRALN